MKKTVKGLFSLYINSCASSAARCSADAGDFHTKTTYWVRYKGQLVYQVDTTISKKSLVAKPQKQMRNRS